MKNTEGEVGPFYLQGVQWIDGSIQADIPFRGISTMFAISNCIVSQVNFHGEFVFHSSSIASFGCFTSLKTRDKVPPGL